ncbi:Protein HOTHEAD [Sesbania bispinosa]|nr:Protein HOTHEAD [Sesbania bispinosa]
MNHPVNNADWSILEGAPKAKTPEAVEKAIEMMDKLDQAVFRGEFILETIMGSISRGHMELRNSDPNENPMVTFNYTLGTRGTWRDACKALASSKK